MRLALPSLRPLVEAMEDRILHSADLATLAFGTSALTDSLHATPVQTAAPDAVLAGSEIAFIDASLPDAGTLLADLQAQQAAGRPIEIVTIGAGQDGVALISATLGGRSDITAVHLLAHGSDGQLRLGSVTLNAQTLLPRAGEVAGWSTAFSEDADLLLYGCDVAQSATGKQFVRDLAALTGADVAASTDLTGAAAAGGNWLLEFGTGRIESAMAIDSAAQQAWTGTLAVTQSGANSAASSGAVSNLSFSHSINAGSDRLLVVQLVIGAGSDASSVTYNGTPLTYLGGEYASGNDVKVELWYMVAPPVGSGTVGINVVPTWGPQKVVAGAATFYGVDQTSPLGAPVKNKSGSGPTSLTVASGPGDLVIDVAGSLGITSSTVGAGQTQLFTQKNGSTASDVWAVSSTEPGAASVVMTESFTGGSGKWAAIAVAVKQASTPVVINATQDTYITNGSTTNYGASTSLVVDRSGGSALGDQRALLQFDLSSIPAGATITSASLQMQATANGGGFNIDVHRLTEAWVQGSANGAAGVANWNQRLPGTSWTSGGGTYDPTAVATLNTSAVGQHSWNLTSLVQAWVAGTTANYGIVIGSPDTGTTTITYDSSEGTTPPRLVVTYTLANVAPTITSNGGGANAAIAVPENTTAVTTVTATDPDSSTLLYSIAGGADAARFAIDGSTGVLRFTVPPNFEAPTDVGANNVYDVTVQASDGSLSVSQAIAVTVNNATEALLTTGEQRVNTVISGTQETSVAGRGSPRAVAMAPAGDYVVVWSSQNQDGGGWGVYGQRYDKTGTKLGGEIAINQFTAGDQVWATVAMDVSGRFVVSWTSANQDGTLQSVYARRFAADGTAGGGEFRVNTTATGNQYNSSVAMDANGNFIVVWQGNGPGDSDGIFGRRFNADGAPIDATEFRVNTDLSRAHYDASVSMNASGAFAVTWDNTAGVLLRRYDSSGAAIGGEINVDFSLAAGNGSVALADNGSLAVVWRDTVFDMGVYLQRYNAAGAPVGMKALVNTTILADQTDPSIAVDGSGNFIVAWEGNGPGDSNGAFAQKFNAAGVAVGGEFRINSTITGNQTKVSLAMLDLNNFVAVWSGQSSGDGTGVSVRQYGTLSFAPVITSNGGGEIAAISIAENTTAVTTVTATDADLPAQTLSYSIVGGDDAGRFSINPVTGVLRFVTAPDFEVRGDVGADNVYDVIVQVSDGMLGTTQAIAVTVTNVNDNAPVSAPASATGPEDTLLAVTLSASDADSAVASFTVQALPANGTLYVDAARATAVVAGTAYLASSDALTLYFWPAANWNGSTNFNFFATDDLGLAGVAANANMTITAVNDAPVAAGASASTGENTVLNASVPAASDVDGTIASYALISGVGAGNGSLTFNSGGSYVFNPGGDFDALAAGASRDVSFTYTATDNLGLASAPATVTITVNGSNDAALLSADMVNLTEANSAAAISASGALTISDVDSPATFASQASTVGSYGSFTIDAAGAWTYTATSAHDAFVAGTTYTDTFTVASADGTTSSVTINILGTNDAAVLSADTRNLTETDAVLSSSGTLTISDVDSAATFVAQTSAAGSYGSFTIDAAGAWTYTATSAHDAFVAGTTYTDTFTVASADGTTSSVTINILGTNDAAVLSADTRNLTETDAVLSTSGTLAISDIDSPATFVAQIGTMGSYGSFAIDAAGAWTYTTTWAHDAFVAGTTYTDTFAVASADGTTTSVTIDIVGSNDAPVASAVAASTGENAVLNASVPAGSDVDGSVASYALASGVGAGNGSLTFNADGSYVFNPGSDFETLAVGTSRDVSFTYAVTDNRGQASAAATVTVTVNGSNDAPVLSTPIADQGASQDAAFTFAVPAGSFSDVDAGDTLSYAATLSSGALLPSWLVFDAARQTFSGTPGNADVGPISVRVTATDGSNASAFGDFTLTVANVNDAPMLANAIADEKAVQDLAFSFTLPLGTFTDADAGDTLTYSATLVSGAALPSWLSFDASTQTFSGTPANADVGVLDVRVAATDGSGASASDDFTLTVQNVNDAPVLTAPIVAPAATQDLGFNFTLPAGSFTDADIGDTLSYAATLASGAALPSWLSFDAATQSFSGNPGNADVGVLALRVTASDTSGAIATADFSLAVIDVNDSPVQAQPLAGQTALQSVAFRFTVPAGSFTDPDAGATLAYSATLGSGAPLPAWLTFDAATQTFGGTPAASDLGTLDIRVSVTDNAGATVQGGFVLNVRVPDAPAALALPQTATEQAPTTPTAPAAAPPAALAASPPAAPATALAASTDSGLAPAATEAATTTITRSTVPIAQEEGRSTSRSDTVLAEAIVPQFQGIDLAPMSQLLHGDELMRKFEDIRRQMEVMGDERHAMIASSVALTSGLSIGYIVWLVRGGVLVTSMLSALPAWQMIDPLPVLAAAGAGAGLRQRKRADGAPEADDPEVERLFDNSAAPKPVVPPPTLAPASSATAITPDAAPGAKETRT